MTRAHWIFLGDKGELGEVPVEGSASDGVVDLSAETAPIDGRIADRTARRLSRRRPLGVIVAVTVDHVAHAAATGDATPLLARLVERNPELPVVVLLGDSALSASGAVLGGPCPTGTEDALERILQETANATLAGLNDDVGPLDPDELMLPVVVRDQSQAWRAALRSLEQATPGLVVSGLYIAAQPDDPATLQAIARDGARAAGAPTARSAWRRHVIAGAIAGGLGVAATVGAWWSVDTATRDMVRHAVQLRQAALAPADGFSHAGLTAVQNVVSLLNGHKTLLPFVPSSWSGELSDLLQEHVTATLPHVLLDPARRHLEQEYAAIVGTVDSAQTLSPSAAREILQRLIALHDQIDAFYMTGRGSGARQWSALMATFGSDRDGRVSLDWLDTADGMVVMTDALKRYEWTPPPLAPLARRVLALAERPSTATDVVRQQVRALEDRLRAALAVLSATDDQDEQSMAAAVHEVLESLKALHSLGVDHADGMAARRDAIEALSTMRASTIAAGLLSPAHWDRAADRLGADVSDERAAALAMRVEGLGALFVAAEDNSAPRVAPWLETATSAMTSLMGAGLDDGASRDIPPLGPLSMAEGPPAPELLERAADRLRKFGAWLETHASALPETLLRPVLRFATVRVALDAAADVASAYAQPAYGNTEGSSRNDAYAYNDTTAPNLRYVVSSLVRLAPGISRDIAWLAGVRAFRALEAIDADFERTNTFDLRPVVAQWSGHGPVLKGSEWRDAQLRRAHLTEGWLRLGSAVDRATPLLDVLRAPEVAEALESPPLIDKWLGLQQTISIGESALDAFTAFLETSVIGFDRNSCGVTVRAPAESVIGRGLRHEAEALSHELETRCIDILRAPLPLPKPRIYAAPPYRFVPW